MKLTWGERTIELPLWLEVLAVCALVATAMRWA